MVMTSAFVDLEDGLVVVFEAPMGLTGWNDWSVSEGGKGEGLVLKEVATLTGFRLMMPFVVATEKEGHGKIHGKFVKALEERMKVEQGGAGVSA